MNKPISYLALLSIIIVSSIFINAKQQTTIQDNLPDTANFDNTYEIHAIKMPSYLEFASEAVPLEIDDVKNRVDRELHVNTYWQSNSLLLFKRASRFFPIIEPILQQQGVPDDFKYLAVIESGLTNAKSYAGAKGVWQFMKSASKENNLEVNANVDERYNLEKATVAACNYLKSAKKRLGSWTLAAAAYNAGRSGIIRRLDKQMVNTYYDLLLGEETSRYVPRIIALKEIMQHPKQYGFHFDSEDLYHPIPTYTVEVDTTVTNLARFAKGFGINYKELKIQNPWLRENKLNNKSRKKYYIKIPQ